MALKNTQKAKEQRTRKPRRRVKIPLASIGILYLQVTSPEDGKILANAIKDEKIIFCNLKKMQRWEEAEGLLFIRRMQMISAEYAYAIVKLQENTLILYPPSHYLEACRGSSIAPHSQILRQ
ncbi:MAG: hypothetical protein ACFFC7_23335 [Candidatus Hermodarchaeota archaeon]